MIIHNVEVNFLKTHKRAQLPCYNHENDSGFDLKAIEKTIIPARGTGIVPVGLTLAYITPGYWFEIKSRSGNFFTRKIICFNGIIDEGYRNDLSIGVINLNDHDYIVEEGDKIAQCVIFPLINAKIQWSSNISNTDRGNKGLGSSGR